MKGYLLTGILLLAFLLTPTPVHACEKLQAKVDRYTTLQRRGGSAKQMNKWRAQRRIYSERHYECIRTIPRIERVNGNPQRSPNTIKRQARRSSNSDNPVTQKLLATCNFWIDTYNRQPTTDTRSQRESACRALDNAEQTPPTLTDTPNFQRPVKECIKPGNLLDDDVRACMDGTREPDW